MCVCACVCVCVCVCMCVGVSVCEIHDFEPWTSCEYVDACFLHMCVHILACMNVCM